MEQVAFITPQDTAWGFSLGGVPQFVVEPAELEARLLEVMESDKTGLIVIDERLIAGLAEDRLREIERAWHGILLVLPSPEKPPEEVEDYAARLIRRAIGYHVRLKL
jgi:V/A-type H+-transporting ATPase subunit F